MENRFTREEKEETLDALQVARRLWRKFPKLVEAVEPPAVLVQAHRSYDDDEPVFGEHILEKL